MYASYQVNAPSLPSAPLQGPLFVNGRRVPHPVTIRHEMGRVPARVGLPPVTDGRAELLTQGPRPVGDMDAETAAALGIGVGVLVAAGVVAGLGVSGYYWGRAVAPNKASKGNYGTIGAVSNIFFPVVGPLVLTVAGAGARK